jgi:hypothetical protein
MNKHSGKNPYPSRLFEAVAMNGYSRIHHTECENHCGTLDAEYMTAFNLPYY